MSAPDGVSRVQSRCKGVEDDGLGVLPSSSYLARPTGHYCHVVKRSSSEAYHAQTLYSICRLWRVKYVYSAAGFSAGFMQKPYYGARVNRNKSVS